MIAITPTPSAPTRSLLEVAPDLACVQFSIVNAYMIGPPDAGDRGWVLVDTGMPGSARRIRESAARRFGRGSRPAAIVLTHGHFDHVGSVRELAEAWDAPVYAHPLERPYLTGASSYPPPDPTVGGGGMACMSFLYPRRPVDLGEQLNRLPSDGSVPHLPQWRWVHTPGHTPGHISLFREQDRVLIAGDAFVTTYQESVVAAVQQPRHVWRPPAYFTTDWIAARRSVQRLAELEPEVAATGHGQPMSGPILREQLTTLAEQFDRIALPPRGRYVRQPAQADEHGVTFVPPAMNDRQALAVVGGGIVLGVIAGMLMNRRR